MNSNNRILKIATMIAKKEKMWYLNPPISLVEVETIEAKYGFTLPEEYRLFVTQIGNGGNIPSLCENGSIQIIPFGETISKQIKEEFPLTKSWNIQSNTDFDQDNSTDELLMEKVENLGHLNLIRDTNENGMSWILIVAGERRGEVWLSDDFGYLRLPDCTFFDWLELYLNKKLISFVNKVAHAEKQAERDAVLGHEIAIIRNLMDSKKRKKIKWNPPVSLDEVKRFEAKHEIILPHEYVTFITKVANGCMCLPTVNISTGGIMFRLAELDELNGLALPFPYQKKSEELERHLLTEYNMKQTIWETEFSAIPKDSSSVWASSEYSVLHGALPIALYNDTGEFQDNAQAFLILNGDYKGQICRASRYNIGIGGTQKGFFSWIIQVLKYGAL